MFLTKLHQPKAFLSSHDMKTKWRNLPLTSKQSLALRQNICICSISQAIKPHAYPVSQATLLLSYGEPSGINHCTVFWPSMNTIRGKQKTYTDLIILFVNTIVYADSNVCKRIKMSIWACVVEANSYNELNTYWIFYFFLFIFYLIITSNQKNWTASVWVE